MPPLRYGAGVKGKIVMSMSYGVLVVTTTIGSEGFGMVNGQNCLVADESKQFARAVVELYANRSLWGKLSKNAIKFVREYFSQQVAKRELLRIIAQTDVQYKEGT